jgi:hypothetical protein
MAQENEIVQLDGESEQIDEEKGLIDNLEQ